MSRNETRPESKYFPPEWSDFQCAQAEIDSAISAWIFINLHKLKEMCPGDLNYELSNVVKSVPEPVRRDYHV